MQAVFLIFQLPVNTYAIDASSVIGKRVQVGDNCYAYVEDLGNRKYTLHLDGYGNLYEKSTLSEEAKMIINFGSSKVIISNGISKIPDRFFSALGLNIIENHSSTLQIGSFNFIFGSSPQVEYYSLPQDFNLADNVYQVINCPETFTTFVDIREKKHINFEYTMYFSDIAKSVIVRDGNKAITNYMFTRCPNLSECTIPASVTYIDPKAFADKNKITIRGYSGSYAEKYANKNDISFKAISSGQEDPSDILTGKTTAKLNVRKGPGTKYAKMGTLSKGAKVEVITKLPSGWYKIKYKGTYGYVLGKYVKLNTPQQDEKVIATGKTTEQLNVRKGSSTKYAKIGSLSKGAKVEIVSKLSNGWYKIKYKGTYGYVSGAYVKLDSEQPKPGEDEKIIATGKTTVSSLNVRSGPSSNYSKLGILTKGTKVEVVERYSNGWYKIKYKGSYGYVSGAYVSLDGSKGEVIATGKTTAGLNVRSGAGTGYKKIGHLNKGTKVEIVTKLSNGWYKIKFNSSYGYVSGDYVKLI